MEKIYGYDKYKLRTNKSLLDFFKDYLHYTDDINNGSLDIKLDYTLEFIDYINQYKNSKIAIIGDYDVDGVTSTSIMYKGLKRYGVKDIITLIPDRFKDGYGMNERLVNLCHELGVKLIITVDNGIKAFSAIDKANELGITVLVTDHHTPDEVLPKSSLVINPHLNNDSLLTKDICGAMVAYLLMKELNKGIELVEESSLAAVGTICDVMPLINENRIIVKNFISLVTNTNTTYNKGLDLLLKRLKISNKSFNVENISFTLGPLLNAPGRLKTANLALDILINEDEDKLIRLIEELINLNDERKRITTKIKQDVSSKIDTSSNANVIYIEHAHEGLVGVVASSICEETKKPTFIFTSSEDGYIKGSGRSPLWCNLMDIANPIIAKINPIAFGGHAGAMGLTFKDLNDLNTFKEELNKVLATITHEEELVTYLRFPNGFYLEEVKDILDELSPFGERLKEPTFVIKEQLHNVKPLGKGHTKFNLNINNKFVECLFFFNELDYTYNEEVHNVYFNIHKEYSSYSNKIEYKVFVNRVE